METCTEVEMEAWIVNMEEEVRQQRCHRQLRQRSQITGNGKRFYRVPASARQGQDESLYVPRKISIGPYHHDTPSCQQGELDKKQYLINFLDRSDMPPLRELIQSLNGGVDYLRDMYDGLDDCWLREDSKEAFLEMMVVDGCCLLEIMMEAMEARGYGEPHSRPVFNHHDMEAYRHDMLLLDNQIPIEVLVYIYEKSDSHSGRRIERYIEAVNLFKSVLSTGQMNKEQIDDLFRWMDMQALDPIHLPSPFLVIHGFFSLWSDGTLKGESNGPSSHLLDVYRWGLLGGKTYTESPIGYDFLVSSFYDKLPSATQLEEAQIGIRPALDRHQIVVSFNKRTGLVLQQIALDDAARSNFHNVVLYERLYPSQSNHFSSYIYFMHCLLKDTADSKLLRTRGILNTTLRDKEVINLFNNLCKNISFHPDKPMDKKISEVGNMLSQRFKKNMQMWRKDLFQNYLRSPWAVVSVFVAFLILTCTASQTIYTIVSYYKKK